MFKYLPGGPCEYPVDLRVLPCPGGYGKDIHKGRLFQKMLLNVVKHRPHRRVGVSHDRLQVADCAQHMAFIDDPGPSQSHQYVLGVI